jgi:hypothetical protein
MSPVPGKIPLVGLHVLHYHLVGTYPDVAEI